jgi:hypothetical protein
MASLIDGRPTPICSASVLSGGILAPDLYSPCLIFSRICSAIIVLFLWNFTCLIFSNSIEIILESIFI